MARRSQNKRHRSRGRGRRGGASPSLLQAGAYPGAETGGAKWSTSVSGGLAAAPYKSLISQVTAGRVGMPASVAMNSYAMKGGSRRRRHRGGTRRAHRGGAAAMGAGMAAGMKAPMAAGMAAGMKAPGMNAPHLVSKPPSAPAASRAQGGGMFASFGALLKEALVPLGLLAAQQTYGKRHSRKHRSSGSHTRKHRR